MWETIERGWDAVSGAIGDTWTSIKESSIYTGVQGFLGDLREEANTPLGKFATWGYNEFMSNRDAARGQLPTAKRVSRPGSPAGTPLKGAGQADMGITPTSTRGAASAMNARPGSPIAVTIQRLQAAKAKGPIMGLTDTKIAVKSRAR